MARKQIQNPEGTEAPQDVPSGVADPAQTDGGLPQPLEGSQGAAVLSGGAEVHLVADALGLPRDEGPSLTVKGPAKGRWRAGRHFGPEVVTIPARDLSESQIEALLGDPELVVIVG